MLILCLILGHLVADFYLQTDEMVKEKHKNIWKHITHHLIVTAVILGSFFVFHLDLSKILTYFIVPLTVIVFTHYLLDLCKIKLLDSIKINNEENLKRVCFFLIDQFLHLVVIILICHLCLGIEMTEIFKVFQEGYTLNTVNAGLFMLIIVILATSVSGHLIRILLGSFPNQLLTFEGKYAFKTDQQEDPLTNKRLVKQGLTEEYHYTIFSKHDLSRGKLIGYIERLLVLVLTFYSAYPAIGFIVAAKSIARFKQMDDRDWAEYFLLGTLTSMFIGISLGIVLREVLT